MQSEKIRKMKRQEPETKKPKHRYIQPKNGSVEDRRKQFSWHLWKTTDDSSSDPGMARFVFAYTKEEGKIITVGVVCEAKNREDAEEMCSVHNAFLSKTLDALQKLQEVKLKGILEDFEKAEGCSVDGTFFDRLRVINTAQTRIFFSVEQAMHYSGAEAILKESKE